MPKQKAPTLKQCIEGMLEGSKRLKKAFKKLRATKPGSEKRAKEMKKFLHIISVIDWHYWHPLDEWWKGEYFKLQWNEGFCFSCNGDKRIMSSTGDPKHPLKAIKCTECKGTGVVKGRKLYT